MPLVYGTCLKYLKDKQLAEDAVIDIYMHVCKKALIHEIQVFKSWLYTVSRNHCLEVIRKQSALRQKQNKYEDVYSATYFHPDNENLEPLYEKMDQCIEKLKEDHKICIKLFYYESMSYEDITEKTDYTWNQVRSHIQNARRKLKLCVENSSISHG